MRALRPDELDAADTPMIGGKANGLLLLSRAGAPVPAWRVIPAGVAAARPWREPDERETLRAIWDELAGDGGVAVRSSANVEDAAHASYAGVFETHFAATLDDLAPALDRVMDSLDAARARAYADSQHGGDAPAMAIVVQRRIAARCAGVAFSAHPASANPAEIYVEAVLGPGGGLVDGERTPSRFYQDSATGDLVRSTQGGDGPDALPREALAALARHLLDLERRFNAPLDVEWAIDAAGALWLLQARPITVLRLDPALKPPFCATSWFFDQRFNEPIRPLTRTALLPAVAEVAFGDALRLRGEAVPEDLLTYYAGQAYAPHATWRAMLRGAPRWFLSADLKQIFPRQCCCPAGAPNTPAMGWGDMFHYAGCSLRGVWINRGDVWRNLRAWDTFARGLDAELAAWRAPDPADPAAWLRAWEMLQDRTRRFLRIHRWSLLWADYLYRLYRRIAGRLPKRAQAALEHARNTDTHSVTAEANDALAALLRDPSPSPETRDRFIARYGHRSPSLDLAVPTWTEYMHGKHSTFAAPSMQDAQGGSAGFPAREVLPESQPRHAIPALRLLLYPLRRFTELREAQRFAWEKILARQRAMILDAATRFASKKILPDIDDVWFLEWREFHALLAQHTPIDPTVLHRRRHAHYVYLRAPRPLFVGPVETVRAPAGRVLQGLGASPGIARGAALVFPAHAPLPHTLPPGKIVVLGALDPAWTGLMRHAAGLVIERGGLLSHAAILAREYRVPLAIGIENATRDLANGETIEIDGEAGTVTRRD